MEAKLYELIGRKQAAFEALDAAYTELLSLLAEVVGGATERSQVLVNLTDRSWGKAPPGFTPPRPAVVNGLPKCVVAPETDYVG